MRYGLTKGYLILSHWNLSYEPIAQIENLTTCTNGMSLNTIRESTLSRLNKGLVFRQFSLCELRLLLNRSNLPRCRCSLVILKLKKGKLSEQCLFYLLLVVPRASSKLTVVIPLPRICHWVKRRRKNGTHYSLIEQENSYK